MRKRLLGLALALAVSAVTASPALAHKLKVFATANGALVEGYVYLGGGTRPAGVPVTVTVEGTPVVHLTTGDEGTFRFTATVRTDHTITATIDGHRGHWTVRGDELPTSLPTPGATSKAPPANTTAAPQPTAPPETTPGTEAPLTDDAALEALIEQAVARQVGPLRAEMQSWREDVRWRDAAGGLGWILGLAGLAAWVSALRKGS